MARFERAVEHAYRYQLGRRVVVLPVDMKHGVLNKELGLHSDYTTTVESFMRSLGLP